MNIALFFRWLPRWTRRVHGQPAADHRNCKQAYSLQCRSLFLVRLGKTTVDDQQLTITIHRLLPFQQLHRHVAVDDGSLLPADRIPPGSGSAHPFFNQLIIDILLFLAQLLIPDKNTAQRLPSWLCRTPGNSSLDQMNQSISCPSLRLASLRRIVSSSGINLQNIIKGFAAVFLSENIYLLKVPLFIERNASVIKQVGIVYFLYRLPFSSRKRMLLQTVTAKERGAQLIHHPGFLR